MTTITTESKIRQLSPVTINRIAAGEVVERPSAVVKELVENSLDAGSTEITIKIESGGKNLILISDNGSGMSREDLELCVERHTTSKLLNDNLLNINYFGFRGEALPSIASVSRMSIKTSQDGEESWSLDVIGGEKHNIKPASSQKGTTIEIRDLFFATPARLKFLRTEKTELQHITEIVKKIALANPKVRFSLYSDQKQILDYTVDNLDPMVSRISQIFNKDFTDNSIELRKSKEGITINGHISVPTYNRATANDYYLYVNNRPVKDKVLLAAVRIAYQDFLSRDRYPMVVLFLNIPSELVDVNVHPSKTEVRFRDIQNIRAFVIHALKEALQEGGGKTSSTIAQDTLSSVKTNSFQNHSFSQRDFSIRENKSFIPKFQSKQPIQKDLHEAVQSFYKPVVKDFEKEITETTANQDFPLGSARCQLHETYIISQTKNSIVIIDQHAAHERLVYEKLKIQFDNKEVDKQRLLIPEIIEVKEGTLEKVLAKKPELEDMGLTIAKCTDQSVIVTEVPHIIGKCDTKKLTQDIIEHLEAYEESANLKELINETLATYACHNSIRSGRKMNIEEMNLLLREMESTPHSGQCNHGRPTYIELELKDIEKLFGRS